MARRSVSHDPDQFFPEDFGDRPDPVGLWLIRRLTSLGSFLESVRGSFARRPASRSDTEETVAAR